MFSAQLGPVHDLNMLGQAVLVTRHNPVLPVFNLLSFLEGKDHVLGCGCGVFCVAALTRGQH